MTASALPRLRRSRRPVPADDEPTRAALQATQRDRRRKHLTICYVGAFDLRTEIAQIVDPLAARISDEPQPAAYFGPVADLGDAVHAAVTAVARMLDERDALRRCAHLPVDERGRAAKLLLDLAERPAAPPEPDAATLADGSWTHQLVDLAGRYSEPLSVMLDRARPSDHMRGMLSVSERLIAELRLIDTAAHALTSRLDYAEHYRRQYPSPTPDSHLDQARAELARLGVEVD